MSLRDRATRRIRTVATAEREDRGITGLIALLITVVVASSIARVMWRHRSSLVSRRGFGVRADVERLQDVPRVRVRRLSMMDANTVLLTLATASSDRTDVTDGGDVEIVMRVALKSSDPGCALLAEWLERHCVLGIVMRPETQIVRLRCLEDLCPLTLRRLDA